ncbi:hypothetical protein [Streptomyces sp. NPDC003863]
MRVDRLSAFVPFADSLISADIVDRGTPTSALCFSAGGILQQYERP